jgi:uncharacterized protein YcfL
MKNILSDFIIVILSLLLTACGSDSEVAQQSQSQQQTALPKTTPLPLKNPSFEESDQHVKSWGFSQHAGEPSYLVSIDTNESTEGKNSYRIERKLVQAWGMINQWLPLENAIGKSVTLSAMVKSENLGPKGFDLSLVFRKANRKYISAVDSAIVTGSNGWQRIEVTSIVPAHTAHLQITAVLNDAGTAWLDDVELSITDQP